MHSRLARLCKKLRGVLTLAFVGALAGALPGCEAAGYVADVFSPDKKTVNVTGEYFGLNNQSVAVLVSADLPVLEAYPHAPLEVSSALSEVIAANVPGVKVKDPIAVSQFQTRNIYWSTESYGKLAEKLGVNRLVVVELFKYQTRIPGNAEQYRGVIQARVEVSEADGPTPHNPSYTTDVEAAYPNYTTEGIPYANELAIRKGMLDQFAALAGGRFYDHTVQRDN